MAELSDKEYWDSMWSLSNLPVEVRKTDHDLVKNALLNVFDSFLSNDASKTALEIGGAPGQYLAYLKREFGYKVHALDYSSIGIQKIRENFRLLGFDVAVYQTDIFDPGLELPKFDIVFSLGFIEHFEDIENVVRKHVDVLRPGGILIIGVPNLGGIYGAFLHRFAPRLMAMHNVSSMNLNNWAGFEASNNLDVLFRQYIGGFEPSYFKIMLLQDHQKLSAPERGLVRLTNLHLKITRRLRRFLPFLRRRRFNSRFWSAYMVGVYRKPTK